MAWIFFSFPPLHNLPSSSIIQNYIKVYHFALVKKNDGGNQEGRKKVVLSNKAE